MKVTTDRFYIKVKETQQLIIKDNNFISSTRNFKYLGSWISYDLNDSYNILAIIKKANQAIGPLKLFWQAKEINMK